MIGLCHNCFESNKEVHLDKKARPECERCRNES